MKYFLTYLIICLLVSSCLIIKEQQELNVDRNLQAESGSEGQSGEAKQKYVVKTIERGDTKQFSSNLETNDSISSISQLNSSNMTTGGGTNQINNQETLTDLINGWSTSSGRISENYDGSQVEFIALETSCDFLKIIDKNSGITSLKFKYIANHEINMLISYLNEERINQHTILKSCNALTEKEIVFSEMKEPCNILIKVILNSHTNFKIRR